MKGGRYVPNYPKYKVNPRGQVYDVLNRRFLTPSRNNKGEHYHLESESGKVVAMKPTTLISWAYPKETE